MSSRRTTKVIAVVVALVALVGLLAYAVLGPLNNRGPPPPMPGRVDCSTVAVSGAGGNWSTYHHDAMRTGVATASGISTVRAEWASPTALDGQLYAEPLACGNTVYATTEGDSVYAINASNGAVIWHASLGTPMPGAALPCGDIDPSGVTGTPVLDPSHGTLYVVAFVTPGQHVLFGLNVANGSVRSQVVVDPAGSDPLAQQQRGALALANGYVYIPFGGLYGDCGRYHGWVVGAPTSGSGGLVAYQVPTHNEGGIWAAGGIVVATDGDLFVTTGNGDSSTTFDHGNTVIELSPTLAELGYFAPMDWAALNSGDTDLGSLAPTILPDGDLFQVGKAGVGYLLSGANLGGIDGQIFNASVCGGAYGGTAHLGSLVLVPCTDGLFAVSVGASSFSVAWHTSSFDAGSPIVTGNVTWVIDIGSATLRGFNVTNGHPIFSFPLGSVDHFISPAATPSALFVGAGSQLIAFAVG